MTSPVFVVAAGDPGPRPSLPAVASRTLPVVLAYDLVLGVMNLCFYQAIQRIQLGIAVTIEFLGPLAVALAGSRRVLDGVWALMSAGGVVLLTEARGELSTVGLLFALGAGICWGAYIMLTAALGNRTAEGVRCTDEHGARSRRAGRAPRARRALHAPQWMAVGLVVLASAGATKYAVRPADAPGSQ